MIPERVSHAYLAGLWPRIGLYSSIAAALAYAGFRRSRFLVAGTNPSLALLLSASIAPMAAQDPLLAAAMASATALMAGVLALGAWALRLGLLSKAMSDHVLIVSPDAELLANGATNVGTGLVGGMPVAASTPLEGSMDSPSVRVLVVSGAVTLLVVILFSVTLADLPMAMLAANLIRHAGHLIGAGVRGLDQTSRRQLVAALATALSVMTLGPLDGMFIAVALTLLDRPWKRVDSTHP